MIDKLNYYIIHTIIYIPEVISLKYNKIQAKLLFHMLSMKI